MTKNYFQQKPLKMSSLKLLNANSNSSRGNVALMMNISASKGLSEVLSSNLGPKGTVKMYVKFCLSSTIFWYRILFNNKYDSLFTL